ncbi:flavodoxin family protein [Methanocorpusculum vombati]|uniref:NAD(P)H-dependent oxidoreductase n=1 Tax=Methanocorpusculum vombati TaxID=3002864 RepID=A0ABT4IKN4_9EURY|nr:NAD(P)H-dependent oxidoreductase [Methanocorpusculum vombati]MCZ9319052.1 NAD(P)H-dependent oxidoreductase [Methanocorpusculum sp.]MCZ0861648.1 NAD(P)H-dependent oxidoreductase [Methanocorpusculum vombati]MDE2521500.1 NAD(P)H-dependent oxidoreductase [Methanocorpusculum sp.]MDE2535118.1 NAD(P)H-dependent oxidoreductase [Methanocorpusculum sp.]MDE2545274.1 NAD(P)H-dependent oxidoreductase [Methanocorpusculum sp.]
MIPHILAISTSPRRHGNSESALDTILAETGDRVSAEKVVLTDLSIAPCKGCGACEKLGRCIQEDDFQPLAQKILDADVLILATPVYSMSVCAQSKALIDRCQVFWSRKYVLHTFEEPAGTKLGLFIATAGQTRDHIFDHTVPVARFLFDVAGIKPKHTMLLLLNGLDKKTDFLENPAAVAKAKDTAAALLASLEVV